MRRRRRRPLLPSRRRRTALRAIAAAGPWRRVLYRGMWLVIAALLALALFSLFWPQYIQYRHYARRIAELDRTIRREQALIKNLQIRQQRLRTDPAFLQRIAHEMGLAGPDEVIFRFVEPETNRLPYPSLP